jgi:hypothetical protein
MYPSISGPYVEPKVEGQLLYVVCPHCDALLGSAPVMPPRPRRRRIVSAQERIDQQRSR